MLLHRTLLQGILRRRQSEPLQMMLRESADLLLSQGPGSINCNWADLELLSIFVLQLQGYSVDTDDQDTSRGQQEAVLYTSPETKHNRLSFLGTRKKIQLIKERKFSLTYCPPPRTFPLLSSFLSLTPLSHLYPEGQQNFMVDTDFLTAAILTQ